jgi:hypothetical protein
LEYLPEVIDVTSSSFEDINLEEEGTDWGLGLIKVCLQLLGNMITCKKDTIPLVWGLLEPRLGCVLGHKNAQVPSLACMLIFNCLRSSPEQLASFVEARHDIISAILMLVDRTQGEEQHSEWPLLVVELFINTSFPQTFNTLVGLSTAAEKIDPRGSAIFSKLCTLR